MTLKEIRDFVASLGIADHVYMGILDSKPEKSIGVYNSKHTHAYTTAIGGPQMSSYETLYVTLLIHWNKLPGETEDAGKRLFDALTATREYGNIKFITPLYHLQDVGSDEFGIREMVIEAAFICSKKGE